MSEMGIIDTLSATKLALIKELEKKSPNDIFADYMDACGPKPSSKTIESNAPAKDQVLVGIKEPPLKNEPTKEIKVRDKYAVQTENSSENNVPKLAEGEIPGFSKALAIFKAIEKENVRQKALLKTQVSSKGQNIFSREADILSPLNKKGIQTIISCKIPRAKLKINSELNDTKSPVTEPLTNGSIGPKIVGFKPNADNISRPSQIKANVDETSKKPESFSLLNEIEKSPFEIEKNTTDQLEKRKAPEPPVRKYFGISEKGEPQDETAESLAKKLDDTEKNREWDKMYDAIDELFTGACGGLGLSESQVNVYENFILYLYAKPNERLYGNLEKLTIAGKSQDLVKLVQLENTTVSERNNNNRSATPEIMWKIPARLLEICVAQSNKIDLENNLDTSAKTNIAEAPGNKEKKANGISKDENIANYMSDTPNNIDEFITASNRFIEQAELDCYIRKINRENVEKNNKNAPQFHGAWAPIKINNDAGASYKFDADKTIGFFNKPRSQIAHFSPILLDDHWYLFGTFYVNDVKQALVYDSNRGIEKQADQDFFRKLTDSCLVKQELIIISESLQENSPNACGLFVVNAMLEINNEKNGNYEDALNKANQAYLDQDKAFQENYNLTGRQELLRIANEEFAQLNAVV